MMLAWEGIVCTKRGGGGVTACNTAVLQDIYAVDGCNFLTREI